MVVGVLDVAVLDVEIEAEVDGNVVGVADVVVKEGIAIVVSGVDTTDVEAGEVEPPYVHNDPNGIYPKESTQGTIYGVKLQYLHLGQSKSMASRGLYLPWSLEHQRYW